MKDYKVTITIEGDEEIETMEFWVGADNFKEAFENIKDELDTL